MPCFGPLTAYRPALGKGEIIPTGRLVFDKRFSHTGIPIKIPCGQCVGCRLEKSRQWAMRCMHEKKMCERAGYPSSFVTLTYDDDNLFEVWRDTGKVTLVLRDLQLFMKRLRKKTGEGVRFYACGEYGSSTARPHYHILLFNRDFPDKKRYRFGPATDHELYTSKALEDLWPAGRNVIGDVSFDSCAYVARYIVDKITGDRSDDHYRGRLPEFTVMSRNPGIGTGFYNTYRDEIYTHDSLVINGREVRPPRFYDTKFEVVDSHRMSVLKRKRRAMGRLHKEDNTSRRRRVREVVELAKLARKRGSI